MDVYMEDVTLGHPPHHHCHHHHRPSSSSASLQHQPLTMPSETMYDTTTHGNSNMYAYAYGHAASSQQQQQPPLSSSSSSRVPSPIQNNSSTAGIVSDQGVHAYNATSTQASADSGADNNNDASLPSSPSTTKSLSSTSPSWNHHLDKAPKHLDTAVAFDASNQVPSPLPAAWPL